MSTEPCGAEPLLGVRAAVVFLLAVLPGAAAGVMTYLAGQPLAAAVLAGCAATGGATTPALQLHLGAG